MPSERRKDARHDALGEDLHAACAGERQRLDRRHVHMLDRLGEEPAEHADRVDGKRKAARKRPEPDRRDEEQRPDQLGTERVKAMMPRER